jgi:hypothetical protein
MPGGEHRLTRPLTTSSCSDTLLSVNELAVGGTATGDVCFRNDTGAWTQYAVIGEPLSFADIRAA